MCCTRERIRHRDGQDFSGVCPVSKTSLVRVKVWIPEDQEQIIPSEPSVFVSHEWARYMGWCCLLWNKQKPGTWCTRAFDDEPGSGQATIHFDFVSDVVLSFLVLRVTSTVPLYRLLLVVQERLRPSGGEQKANLKHLGTTLLVESSRCRTSTHLATTRQKQPRHHGVPSSTQYSHPPP